MSMCMCILSALTMPLQPVVVRKSSAHLTFLNVIEMHVHFAELPKVLHVLEFNTVRCSARTQTKRRQFPIAVGALRDRPNFDIAFERRRNLRGKRQCQHSVVCAHYFSMYQAFLSESY